MSDPGQQVGQVSPPDGITPTVAQIRAGWLRDFVVAFTVLARPFVIWSSGFAVALAAIKAPTVWEVVGLAAGLAGGVGFLRTLDKKNSLMGPS